MLDVFTRLWPLGLALLVFCVVGVACVVSRRAVWPWFGAVWGAVTAAMAAGGVGASWSTASYVGKLAALALTCCLPLGAAALVFATQRRGHRSPGMMGVLAFSVGLPLVLAAPFTGVALACAFTGDCL
jgi:hypothetical protein